MNFGSHGGWWLQNGDESMINIVDDHVNVVYIDMVRFSVSICLLGLLGGHVVS